MKDSLRDNQDTHETDTLHLGVIESAFQVLAALLDAPRGTAYAAMHQLQPSDFTPDWKAEKVYRAMTTIEWPKHQNFGAVHILVERQLLENGDLKDNDDGLSQYLQRLVGCRGAVDQLPLLVRDLLDRRYREWAAATMRHTADLMDQAPQHEADTACKHLIEELRARRMRLPDMPNETNTRLEVVQ